MSKIQIKVNEKEAAVTTGTTLSQVRTQYKADSDVIILNGAPCADDPLLADGDTVVLIKKGEMPTHAQLEALMYSRHTPGVHDKIKNAVIGVAGAGGLGSSIAVALVRVGIGKLIVADFDVVEPSNLNRQQYFVSQIGMQKVDALKENLERINPYVSVEAHSVRLTSENIPEIFSGINIMLEAFDKADQKAMLAETFRSTFPDILFVGSSGMAGCYSSNLIKTIKISENFYIVGDLVNAAGPGEGLMAPRVGVASHHQANCALRILLGLKDEE